MYKPMFKKLGLVFVWFLVAAVTLGGSVFYLQKNRDDKIKQFLSSAPTLTASGSNQQNGQVLGVKITDMRPYFISNFLKNTVLEPYSTYMVEVADKYNIDYRLIPAIAMKESGGGNASRQSSYNAWGFENGRTNFESWNQAIDNVGKTLKERYIAKGMDTPDKMMAVYAPPAVLSGGGWAKDINAFFAKLEIL